MANYTKHTWVNRQGTGLNKFTNTGTLENLILTPNPDSISQEGTPFTAAWMNEMETGIANGQFLTGTTAPSASLGVTGQIYLRTSTNQTFIKLSSGWVLFGGASWHQLGTLTTTTAANGVSMTLTDSLANYTQLYVYANIGTSGSTAYSVFGYLGGSTGESIITLTTSSTANRLVENWEHMLNTGLTAAQGYMFGIRVYTGSTNGTLYATTTANITSWDTTTIYFKVPTTTVTITSGSTITVWGWQ